MDATIYGPKLNIGDCVVFGDGAARREGICIDIHYVTADRTDYELLSAALGEPAYLHYPDTVLLRDADVDDSERIVNLHFMTIDEVAETLLAIGNMYLLGVARETVSYGHFELSGTHMFIKAKKDDDKILHISTKATNRPFTYFHVVYIDQKAFDHIIDRSNVSYEPVNQNVTAVPLTKDGMFDFLLRTPVPLDDTVKGVDLDYAMIYDFNDPDNITRYDHGFKIHLNCI